MAKYRDICDWITENIENGQLSAGMKIPSENELCGRFGVSRQTVRRALQELSEKGLVRSRRGSGSYVTDNARPAESSGVSNIASKRAASRKIAVVTTYVDSYIFPAILSGAENRLAENGYITQISFTNNTFRREEMILRDLITDSGIAGLIIEPTKSSFPNPNISLYKELMAQGMPILFINSFYRELPLPHVSLNDRECARTAVKWLQKNGHRKIGCVSKLDDGQGRERYLGYIDAMVEKDIIPEDDWCVWLDTSDMRHPSDAKEKLIRRLSQLTAVFCYNDEVAVMLEELFRENGIRVPDDMSLVSIDNSRLAHLSRFGIDSVDHPKEKLGRKAAENIINMISDPTFNALYEFTAEVEAYGSVAWPARDRLKGAGI